MSFKNQVILLLICYFISFINLRAFLYGVIRYQLNNSAYKKRKKGESFVEWLFYKRYKEEIPKIWVALYYAVLTIHPVCLIACFLAYIICLPINIGEFLAVFVAFVDSIGILIKRLLFWSKDPNVPYERWITKKRGQKPKKK